MRSLIYQALAAIPAIAEDCEGRMYQSGSLGVGFVPAEPDRPYVLITQLPGRAFPEVRETSVTIDRYFQVWVYDERGDFARIDNILAAVRETILGLVGQVDTAVNNKCLQSIWETDSQDLVDSASDLSMKFGLYKLTSTG